MDTLAAVSTLLNLVSSLTELSMKVQTIALIIQKAQAEGRTTLTDEEWAGVVSLDDQARATLQAAIDAQPRT